MSQDFFHHFLEGLGKKGRKSASDHIRRIVTGTPEVVVKISGFTYNFAHLKRHFAYISRHGNLCLENEQGYEFRDPSEIESILQYWKKYHSSARKDVLRAEDINGKYQQNKQIRQGFTKKQDAENLNDRGRERGRNSAKQNKRVEVKEGERAKGLGENDAVDIRQNLHKNTIDYVSGNVEAHAGKGQTTRGTSPQRRERLSAALVFSMPAGTDPLVLKHAVRAFAQKTFKDYRYVMVLHEDADHLHIHLTLDMRGNHNRKLHIARGDPQKWREGFALALEEQNIPAEATPRKMRGITLKTPSQAMLHLKGRGVKLERQKALISDLKALWRKSSLPSQEMNRGNDTGQHQESTQKQQREQTKGQGNAQKQQEHPIPSNHFEDTACVKTRQKYQKNHHPLEETLQKRHHDIRHSWLHISESYQQTDPILSKMIVDFVDKMPHPVSRRELLQQKIFHSVRDIDMAQKLYHDHPELEPEILKILMAEQYIKQTTKDPVAQEEFMNKLIQSMSHQCLLGKSEMIPVMSDPATAQKFAQMQNILRGEGQKTQPSTLEVKPKAPQEHQTKQEQGQGQGQDGQGEQHLTHASAQPVSTRHRKKHHKHIENEQE